MKWLFAGMVSLMLMGCWIPAEEIHGGAGPKPAPPEAIWWGSGFLLDQGLQVARVRAPYRIPLVVLSAFTVREVCMGPHCKYFGRTADSGVLMVFSSGGTELGNCFLYALTKKRWFGCR